MIRRDFIGSAVLGTAGIFGLSCSGKQVAGEKKELFSFIHYSDVHIQPEKGAKEGFLAAVNKMNSLKPDFAVSGGDLVMDALAVDEKRATGLYGMYSECCKSFDIPHYDVMGNHEVFGITAPDKVPLNHPEWGKEMFKKRLGNGATYRSFDHKGVHFLLLDSVGIEKSPDGKGSDYIGQIGPEQMAWLKSDLAKTGPETPVIAVAHIPVLTLYDQITKDPTLGNSRSTVITDGKELLNILSARKFIGFLEGHIHVNEFYRYKGVSVIDTAAVCGAWWDGPRDGHPEGFNLVHVFPDEIKNEYITYGWDAAKYS